MSEQLALLGGTPIGGAKQPRFPVFDESAIREVTDLLERGETVGLGRTNSVIRKAEEAISSFHDGRHAMCLSSGHSALLCALMGLGVGPGDEVITTPYTWGASISCILHVGAIPLFADVEPETGVIDPATIPDLITSRTKAILPVHIYGQPCDMPRIQAIAAEHNLKVIEDGSQAHGATIDGVRVGNFSDAAAFSCMGGKLLATAEAGYLVTADDKLLWRAAMMCQHYGRSAEAEFPEEYKPYVDSLVYTFRLSPVIAALFPSQLERLPAQVEGRQQNAAAFAQEIESCKTVRMPVYPEGVRPAFHFLTLNFDREAAGIGRDTFLEALRAEGAGACSYVPEPINKWKRLQWQDYQGPEPFWLPNLKAAGTDYASISLPACEYRVENSIELGWNFYEPGSDQISKLASIFHKVEDNLPALRVYEQKKQSGESIDRAVAAAKVAAANYRR